MADVETRLQECLAQIEQILRIFLNVPDPTPGSVVPITGIENETEGGA